MAEISGLSVRVSAATQQFRRGISRAQEATQDLSLSLRRLSLASSSADRDLEQTGRSAVTTAASLSGLSIAATGTSSAFLGLSLATAGALVPALITLSAVAFPLIAAFGGFLAVAGAIAGVGLAGTLGAIAVNGSALKTVAQDTAAIFRDVFEPAIDLATLVLTQLLTELGQVASELVPTQQELFTLAGLFTELGSSIIQLLPDLVDVGVTLATEFLPPLIDLVQDIGPQLPGIVNSLVDTFERLAPTLQSVGRFLTRFLPEFTEFGFRVLNVISPAIEALGRGLLQVTREINQLDSSIQGLVIAGSVLLPVVTGLASLLGGPVVLGIAAVTAGVVGLARAFRTNFAGIRDDVNRFVGLVQGVLPAAQQAFQSFIRGVNLPAIRSEIDALVSVIDTQLTQTLIALGPVFNDIKQLLQDNQEEFRVIGSVIGAAVGGLIKLTRIGISVLAPAFRSVIIPILRGFIDVIDFGLTKLSQFIQLADAIKNQDLDAAISEANQLFGGGETPSLNVNLPGQGAAQRTEQRIEVVLEENTDIVDSRIRDTAQTRAELVVQQQSDRAQRNSGSTGL